ncbi:MAG: hypothetical protein RIQ33_861 [Bacteroidota bacterium]|jgi:mRNA-degrading endonuclease RelE of RelBE toxin-antitoxin system
MNRYFIEISKKADKNLASIPKKYYKLIREHIDELAINPFPSGCKKLSGSELYRI